MSGASNLMQPPLANSFTLNWVSAMNGLFIAGIEKVKRRISRVIFLLPILRTDGTSISTSQRLVFNERVGCIVWLPIPMSSVTAKAVA